MASPEAIREPHIVATTERMVECGGPVLVAQDTVFFSDGEHPKTRGLGPIGKRNEAHDRGLIMHNALAFTASGAPLGLLSQRIRARREIPREECVEKILRLQRTAIDEKVELEVAPGVARDGDPDHEGRTGRHDCGPGVWFL